MNPQGNTLAHRPLGLTGVRIPVLGLGTGPIGHRPEAEAIAFLHRCIDLGVTHWDTGPRNCGYGDAQRYVGKVLAERRGEVFVATHCRSPDGESALRELQAHLYELGTDQVDLVYVHSLGDEAMAAVRILAKDGACRALDRARRDGLTRYLGISGHHRPARFLRVIREWDPDVVLTAVNLVSRHSYGFQELVWPEAAARGMGLIGMKVLGGVSLAAREARGARLPPELQRASMRHVLGLEGASGVVVGMVSQSELEQSLEWVRELRPLTDAARRKLDPLTRELAADWGHVYGPPY